MMTWRMLVAGMLLLPACGESAQQAPSTSAPEAQSRAEKARELLEEAALPPSYHPWRDQTDAELDETGAMICDGFRQFQPIALAEFFELVDALGRRIGFGSNSMLYGTLVFRAFHLSYCPDLQFKKGEEPDL